MKVLLITEFFPDFKKQEFTGGVEARTFFIGQALARENKVSVICRKTELVNKVKRLDNLILYPAGLIASKIVASFSSVFERIYFMLAAFFKALSLDFDVVEGSNFVTYLPAFLAGLFKKKPRVAWFADVLGKNWFKYFGLTGFFGWLMEKISLYLPWTKIIALSQQTQSKLVSSDIRPNKIKVIYGGVDLKNLKPKTLKQEPKVIICISRLVKYKRVGDLIKAFSRLIAKYPHLNLTIVGQGPEEMKLKQLAKKLNAGLKIKFLKNLPRKQLTDLLQKSYLLCLPSVVEGFGLVTIEAAACGIPYVIADIKVNQEITKNGQGGLFFKRKNINDLKEKIERFLKDKALYKKKQLEGLSLSRNYDWSKIASQTLKVYDKASYE